MSFKNTRRINKPISPLTEKNVTPDAPSKCKVSFYPVTNIDTTL